FSLPQVFYKCLGIPKHFLDIALLHRLASSGQFLSGDASMSSREYTTHKQPTKPSVMMNRVPTDVSIVATASCQTQKTLMPSRLSIGARESNQIRFPLFS